MNTHGCRTGIRSFTLVEIMITMVITGVLATIAVPAYQNFIEDGKAQMCSDNLAVLGREYQNYVVEHNVVPGDIGQLPKDRIEKALAQASDTAGWKVKLALFIDEQLDRGYAFAGITQELARGNLALLICPSDPRRKQGGVVSYGFNRTIEGMTKDQFMALDNTTLIVGDCVNPTFTSLENDPSAQRHKHIGGLASGSVFAPIRYANGFTKGGFSTKVGSGSVIADLKRKEKVILDSTPSQTERKRKIHDLWRHWRRD